MGVNSLPKTVTQQRRGCDLNPGHTAPESSTLTTRLPSHPVSCINPYVSPAHTAHMPLVASVGHDCTVSSAKTAEPIEMSLGGRLASVAWAQVTMY